MTDKDTLAAASPEFRPLLLIGAEGLVAEKCAEWSESGFCVRRIRGDRMRSSSGLFDEISAAFQFPWYFGGNWDALKDCLADLGWLAAGSGYVVVVTRAEQLLIDTDLQQFDILVRVIKRVAQEFRDPATSGGWPDRSPVAFSVVLASDLGHVSEIERRWRAAGVVVAPFDLSPIDLRLLGGLQD